jgi:hypothetical protein
MRDITRANVMALWIGKSAHEMLPMFFLGSCFVCLCLQVWAPRGGYLMRGITRANVMALCKDHGVMLRECDFYLTQVILVVRVLRAVHGLCWVVCFNGVLNPG